MRIERSNNHKIRFKNSDSIKVTKSSNNINSPLKRKTLDKHGKAFFYFLIFFITIFGIFGYQVLFSDKTTPLLQNLTRLPIVREIRSLVGVNSGLLKGESIDRINALVMGQGGPGHPGPYLTDTMILISLKISTGQISMLSIPRDLVVEIPGIGSRRINEANSWGEVNDYPGGGAALATQIVEKTFKLPINYYARVDFTSFENIIDKLGGVTVDIQRSFTDYQYPDNSLGYQVVSFKVGKEKLNGARALQYVRSRHAEGEGGDFARAKRQQQVILALKEKVLKPSNFLNPNKLIKIAQELEENTSSNIQIWEAPRFLNLAKQVNFNNIITMVLDDGPGGPLYPTVTPEGAYVLAPKISDYSELQFIAHNLFTIADIRDEESKLIIQNGTTQAGLAKNSATIFSLFKFKITQITNAINKDYKKTVLYDLSGNAKPNSLKFLENTLQVKAQKNLPLNDNELPETDFLIILGQDQISSN